MNNIILSILVLFGSLNFSWAQKKNINSDAYDLWKSIENEQIAKNGSIVSYELTGLTGNGILVVNEVSKGAEWKIIRAKDAIIYADGSVVLFKIDPGYDTIRSLKLAKANKKKYPLDSAGVLIPGIDTILKYEKIESWIRPEGTSDWAVLIHHQSFDWKPNLSKKEKKLQEKMIKKGIDLGSPDGKVLRLVNLKTFENKLFEGVKEVSFSEDGSKLSWVYSKKYKNKVDSSAVMVFDCVSKEITELIKLKGDIVQLNTGPMANEFVFLASADTAKNKEYSLHFWQNGELLNLADSTSVWLPNDKSPSKYYKPQISRSVRRIYFGIGNKPRKEEKDSLTEEEKYELDLWSWTDGKLQPYQLRELKWQDKKSDIYMFDILSKKVVQITDSVFGGFRPDLDHDLNTVLLTSQEKYLHEMSWDGWYFDFYTFNLETGQKKLVLERSSDMVSLAPDGQKVVHYNREDSSFYAIICENRNTINLSKQLNEKFYVRNHDIPALPYSRSEIIWNHSSDAVLVYGQNNVWQLNLNGENHQKRTITSDKDLSFQYLIFDRKQKSFDLDSVFLLKSFNYRTKTEGLWKLQGKELFPLFEKDKSIYNIKKAEDSAVYLVRMMDFSTYPDIEIFTNDFVEGKKISQANPQQSEFNWGSVSLVNWVSYKGDSLSGLLYKPENFDASKQYPLMVYFYEKYSDNLHTYYPPKPTASIIYATEYVSNGYIVFIPDINYDIGHPAQCAYDCIVSGTLSLLKNCPFIDSSRMALQGQSWGGYQTAQLITMTGLYKCAMAGAPVSNMFSAYGGIRWGTGMSRAFQYEKTQSRIGKTIWDAPELYFENSPLFHLPKVNTPLLIMHNDGDGAVPWYQGIELFCGLRRLNKPVWMLNYNNEEHNLQKLANKRDLSIRMRQYFDHYLLNKPAPKWMLNGIPAHEKGKYNGYDLYLPEN